VHGLEGLYLHSHKHYYMTQQRERSSVTQQLRRSEANLLRAGLINPQRGIRDKFLFSDEDVKQFLKLKELLENGSVPEAIRMMQQNITPGEALSKYMQAQRQIEVLQRKILQLRKPFWKRILDWFRGLFARGLSRQPG
jgi:hypothetical protein